MHRFLKWREALNLAPNVKSVEDIMDDYLDAITPILGVLPDECRASLSRPLDIQSTAVSLMHGELRFRGSTESAALLHEVAHTFASASVRIAQLHSAPPGTSTGS